jgi:TolB-like protein
MKKVILLIIFALAIFAALPAQEKKVTILNFVNTTSETSNDTLTGTVQGIITSGIRYIGTYKILGTPSFTVKTDKQSLKEYASLTGSEYIIYGSIGTAKNGTSVLSASLYCASDSSILTKNGTIENALEIFGISDDISLAILSELYKTKIAYGSISLKTGGYAGHFSVYINDVLAGSDRTSFDSIPDGNKTLRIVEKAAGGERTVYNEPVLVKQNETVSVTVSFAVEAKKVPAGKSMLTITTDPPGMKMSFDNLETVQMTPFTIELAPGTYQFRPDNSGISGLKYEELPAQWVTLSPGVETVIPFRLNPLMGEIDLSRIPEGYRVFLNKDEIPSDENRLSERQAGVYVLTIQKGTRIVYINPIEIPANGVYKAEWGTTDQTPNPIPKGKVEFRRNTKFWDSVEPIKDVEYPLSFFKSKVYSIKTVKLAQDDKYLYWHVDFIETNPLVSPPPGANEGILMQFCIQNITQGKNLNIDLFSDNREQSGDIGIYSGSTGQYNDLGWNPSRILEKTSATGSVSLEIIRKYVSGVRKVDMALADKDWKQPSWTSAGWVDFDSVKK